MWVIPNPEPAGLPGVSAQSVPAPVAAPVERGTTIDPFRAYGQIKRPAPSYPAGVAGQLVPLADRPPTLPPPPVALLPALPASPTPPAPKPKPPTLRERLQGWTAEAVASGTELTVLLSRRGERGLYRVGETLEERIRIERIESNRVILVRDGERATLEVLP